MSKRSEEDLGDKIIAHSIKIEELQKDILELKDTVLQIRDDLLQRQGIHKAAVYVLGAVVTVSGWLVNHFWK